MRMQLKHTNQICYTFDRKVIVSELEFLLNVNFATVAEHNRIAQNSGSSLSFDKQHLFDWIY